MWTQGPPGPVLPHSSGPQSPRARTGPAGCTPLGSGATNAPFCPSSLFPENMSPACCLYCTYWRCTGVNKPSSARKITPTEGSSPLLPHSKLCIARAFGGSHCTCTELSRASENAPIRPSPPSPGENRTLRQEQLTWLGVNSQHPRPGGQQPGPNSSSATNMSHSSVRPRRPVSAAGAQCSFGSCLLSPNCTHAVC